MSVLRPRRALLSVSDKSGLVDFARGLVELGFEILSTGGTQKALADAGLPVTAVADVTGAPEILDGRVKTLHPKVHGGILADLFNPDHRAELARHGIQPIEVVAVNLYPFARTVATPGASERDAIENIDVGGPTMLRAAAKNHAHVWVVVDPDDYVSTLAALGQARPDPTLRRQLATKAFDHTARYDRAVADWLVGSTGILGPSLELVQALRYGENPHQTGAVYRDRAGTGLLGGMRQIQGKELSWNNLLDADAARKLVALFDLPTVNIVKHNNPCGVGLGDDLESAYRRALATDPIAAFGSIVAVNRPADEAFVVALTDLFVEVLIAPAYSPDALARLAAKKNLRVIEAPLYSPRSGEPELRAIDGGFLAQEADGFADSKATWTCPTRRSPSDAERRALEFAWSVARYVKSNAIVIASSNQTLGIGAGQMSRVDSCRLAISKANLALAGAVAASDAFFPFRDGIDALFDAGIVAVVQPGGSKRDDEVIAAADERGAAMLFTGVRHFRH